MLNTLNQILALQQDISSSLSSVVENAKVKVSIEGIPTQDAVVVTNNILHPFLDVFVVDPVTKVNKDDEVKSNDQENKLTSINDEEYVFAFSE